MPWPPLGTVGTELMAVWICGAARSNVFEERGQTWTVIVGSGHGVRECLHDTGSIEGCLLLIEGPSDSAYPDVPNVLALGDRRRRLFEEAFCPCSLTGTTLQGSDSKLSGT
jgi:hypothetical protein